MIHDAEEPIIMKEEVLITVIINAEFNEFKQIMKQIPSAFGLCPGECSLFWDGSLKQIL